MEFNENQLKVINEFNRNIYLTAPAGTGKTMVLSERICKMLDKGIDPKQILCITFTNKACMELKERILDKTEGRGKDVIVKTFHSFCLSIIKEFAKKKTDFFYDFTVFDQNDTKELIKRISEPRNLDPIRLQKCIDFIKEIRIEKDNFTESENKDLLRVLEIIKNSREKRIKLSDLVTYKEGYEFIKDSNLENLILSEGNVFTRVYNTLLATNRGIDFNDILSTAKIIFRNKEVVEEYRERFKYICIDEMQDTGLIEYGVIRKIFDGNNVLLCGDSFQTIYSFRGSKPLEILEDFRKFNPIEISFNENYRSTKKINNLSKTFLKNAFKDKFNEIYSNGLESFSKEDGDDINILSFENPKEESRGIIKICKELQEKGANLKSTCILTRNNYINTDISMQIRELQEKNLNFEFALVDDFNFFKRVEVKDVIGFFKVIINEHDTVNLERILKKLNTKVSKDTISSIMDSKTHKKLRIKINDYVSEYSEKGEYYTTLIEEFKNSNIVVFDVESTGVNVTEDEIIQIAAIKLDSNGNEIDKFERFIKPSKTVGSSYFVHNFSDEYLKEVGEEKEIVFKDFLDYIDSTVIVGHNVNYDISIFSSELKRAGMKKMNLKGVYDTLEIYRRFYSQLPNHKLEYLSKFVGTKTKPSHNALDDIRATGEILTIALNEKIIPFSEERKNIINKDFDKFRYFRESLKEIRKNSYELRSYEMIDYLLEKFNFFGSYSNETKDIKKENISKLREVLKIVDEKEKSPRDSIIESINLTGLSNGDLEEILVNKNGKIRIPILTIHQAKGLEFENIILSGLQEGTFPNKKGDIEEEKRLFYVGLTRGKRRIFLTYSMKNKWNKRVDRSHFIDLLSK